MSQSDPSSATPIAWTDEGAAGGQPAWQGPTAFPATPTAPPVPEPTPEPEPAPVPEPAPAPEPTPEPAPEPLPQITPEPEPAPVDPEPWVQEGTAHTADEVHQAWTEHHTSPEALAGEVAPPPPSQAPAAPVPTPWQVEPAPAVPEPAPAAEPEPAAEEDNLTLGRARSNSIVLDDMLVSRHHARISADDHGLVIEDLGSRNGTFVNGRRVQTTRLHEGDRIGIGASTFEVRDGWLVSG